LLTFKPISAGAALLALLLASPCHAITTDNSQQAHSESIRLLVLKEEFLKLKAQLDKSQEALQQLVSSGGDDLIVDVRNRTLLDDLRDYLISKQDQLQINSIIASFKQAVVLHNVDNAAAQVEALRSILDSAPARETAIKAYWSALKEFDREQQLWRRALEIDGLPANTAHDADVIAAEEAFREVLAHDTVLKDSWKPLLKELVPMLIADRNKLARRVAADLSRTTAIKYYTNTSVASSATAAVMNDQSPADKNKQVNVIVTTSATPSTGPAINSHNFTQAKLKQPIPNLDDYFPASCKRKGEEGVVVLSIKIDRNGNPTSAGVVASSGSDVLDNAALSFYEKLQFDPARVDADAVETTIKLPVNFRLEARMPTPPGNTMQ
jgi:TonB family protein